MTTTTTATFIGYLFTDGGRQASGRRGKTGDCVTRAAALLQGFRDGLSMTDFRSDAWGSLYDRTYKRLAVANRDGYGGNRSARNGIYKADYEPVFVNDFGFVKIRLGKGTRPTYSEAYHRFGPCIVKTRKHVCALIDGKLLDNHDGRTYPWPDDYGDVEIRERKAMSVYALPGWDANPDGSQTLPTGAKYTRLTEAEYYRRYGGFDERDASSEPDRFVIRNEADLRVMKQAIADYEAKTADDDDGLTTIQRAVADNKAAWEGHIPDDDVLDDRAGRLADDRNLADAVSAALEGESREDRKTRRKFEADAGKYGRVYYISNLLAEVRIGSRWKVLYQGATLFPTYRGKPDFPCVASRLLDDIRMRRVTDVRLVPLDFRTDKDDKTERTAGEYEEERFLNIAAE